MPKTKKYKWSLIEKIRFLFVSATKIKIIKPAIIKRINTDIVGSRSIFTCVKPMTLQVADQKNKAPRNNNKFDFTILRF